MGEMVEWSRVLDGCRFEVGVVDGNGQTRSIPTLIFWIWLD